MPDRSQCMADSFVLTELKYNPVSHKCGACYISDFLRADFLRWTLQQQSLLD